MESNQENKENNQQLSNLFTPGDCNLLTKISKNELSDSSIGENFFQNISTQTRSDQKNKEKNKNYLFNIKDTEVNNLCRKIDFSMELDSNDSKDIDLDDVIHKVNIPLAPLKEDSNNSLINVNNKLSNSSDEQMDLDEELDLRLIKKQSSKSMLSLKKSKFDEDYIIVKTLSVGENGNIYLCMKIQDNKTYVVKMSTSFTRKIDFYNLKNIINDIEENSKNIFHDYVHRYIDYWIEENIINEKMNKRIIYMVSDYCPNDNLIKFIQKIKICEALEKQKNNINLNILNPDFYWDIIFQMMISLEFFHQIGYIHLDIKPTNYLVDVKGNLQLTDFSLSIKNSEKDKLINLYEYEGDSKYISPEVFYKQNNNISYKTDIFSLGLSIYELLTEIELPLNGEGWQNIRKIGVEDVALELISKKFGVINGKMFINLIKIMTNVNSSLRPDINSILNDEKNFDELYKRFMSINKHEFKLSYDINKIPGFICPKYDFSSNNINNINLNDLFMKRSDSMKLNNLGEQ